MEREEIKSAMEILAARVTMSGRQGDDCSISFDDLGREEMIELGITTELAANLSTATWWSEMVEDVLETADFCDPGTKPDEVLEYARDVVREYIRKRL